MNQERRKEKEEGKKIRVNQFRFAIQAYCIQGGLWKNPFFHPHSRVIQH